MSLFLGIDIGTFEAKGVITDGGGAVVATARRAHRMQVPRPGWAEHDAEADWWGGFVAICRELLAAPAVAAGDIAGVACSAIGPCMLPVDAEGRPLMNAVLYGVDGRAAAEVAELSTRIGTDALVARTGNALTSQSVGPKILWLRRNRPDVWERTARILTSTSFLVERLTGEVVIDHYSAAGFGPLYDIAAGAWTEELAPDIIAPDRMPRLAWTAEIAGAVTANAAAETGLVAGTPVTAGTIDAAAEAVSVGVRHPGDMMMMYGSTVFIIQVTAAPVLDGRLWSAPWLGPGTHASMAGLATSGTLTHWFRERFAQELPQERAFEALAAEAAASPPGARGLLLLPYFSGERTPIQDPLAKGAIFGLNVSHSRGDVYRALLEGIAYGTAHVTETYGEIGATPARSLAVGGGTKNPVWLQATSDITGLPQVVCEKTLGAAFGDAFLAACAVGAAAPEDIDRWNPPVRRIEPERHPAYARNFSLFKQLYLQTRGIAHALSEEPRST